MVSPFSCWCVFAITFCALFSGAAKEERLWSKADGRSSLAAVKDRLVRQAPASGPPYELFSAHTEFVADLKATLEALKGNLSTVLIHTGGNQQGVTDAVVLVTGSTEANISINTSCYYNLKVISHLPVRAVSVLLPHALANSTLTNATIGRLEELQGDLEAVNASLEDGFLTDRQAARAINIVEVVSSFVNNVTMNVGLVTMETLQTFTASLQEQLGANANDSVQDYLKSLNGSLMDNLPSDLEELLNGSLMDNLPSDLEELVVVITHQQFSYPTSFLTQYYEQLLNYSYNERTFQDNQRIVLLPIASNFSAFSTTPSLYAHSDAVLQNTVGLLFNNSMDANSVHVGLDTAASEFICSAEFNFSSCIMNLDENNPPQLPPGFRSRTERIYAIFLIAFATIASVFGIIVLCVIVEDRVLKHERRGMFEEQHKAMSKKGSGLLTPLEAVRQRSNSAKSNASRNGTVRDGDSETVKLLDMEAKRKSEVVSTL